MKILVAVKEVTELEDNFEIDGLDVPEAHVQYALNEWDDYAIEEAVQLSEERGDVEVVSVTLGPSRAEETIRMALAKGVDRAIRVWDDTIESVERLDIDTKAEIIATIAEEEECDLVLSGVQSADEANSATGVAVAEKLGFGWAAVVNSLDVDDDGEMAYLRRELEGGLGEETGVELPAVLTIQSGINEPRYASMRGIRQAQRKPLETQSLADIGLDEDVIESPLSVTAMYEPESSDQAEIWEGDSAETAQQLVDLLTEKGVVDG